MSWSIQCIGKPENVVAEIERVSAELTGQSKVEFDDAKPHLVGLVRQNFVREGSGYAGPLIKLDAQGSGTSHMRPDGSGESIQSSRNCKVTIEPFYSRLV